MDAKVLRRQKIRYGIRRKVAGTAQRPRLSVFRSNTDIYAQVIDDDSGRTVVSASTADKDLLGKSKAAANRSTAEKIGKTIAERLLAKKTDTIVFDRGGFQYHGKVKALADAARAGGLQL